MDRVFSAKAPCEFIVRSRPCSLEHDGLGDNGVSTRALSIVLFIWEKR